MDRSLVTIYAFKVGSSYLSIIADLWVNDTFVYSSNYRFKGSQFDGEYDLLQMTCTSGITSLVFHDLTTYSFYKHFLLALKEEFEKVNIGYQLPKLKEMEIIKYPIEDRFSPCFERDLKLSLYINLKSIEKYQEYYKVNYVFNIFPGIGFQSDVYLLENQNGFDLVASKSWASSKLSKEIFEKIKFLGEKELNLIEVDSFSELDEKLNTISYKHRKNVCHQVFKLPELEEKIREIN